MKEVGAARELVGEPPARRAVFTNQIRASSSIQGCLAPGRQLDSWTGCLGLRDGAAGWESAARQRRAVRAAAPLRDARIRPASARRAAASPTPRPPRAPQPSAKEVEAVKAEIVQEAVDKILNSVRTGSSWRGSA